MKNPNKFMIILIAIPVVILLFFATNIYGYFRFKSYCASEGGLRVYEPLEKNVGWWAKDYNDAHTAAVIPGVRFVRFTDKNDGKIYDLKYIGGNPQDDSAFEKRLADETELITYGWRFINYEDIKNETRLGRFGYEAYLLSERKISARYYMFEYSVFENPLLGGPSSIECFHEGGATFKDLPRSLAEIVTAFRN